MFRLFSQQGILFLFRVRNGRDRIIMVRGSGLQHRLFCVLVLGVRIFVVFDVVLFCVWRFAIANPAQFGKE